MKKFRLFTISFIVILSLLLAVLFLVFNENNKLDCNNNWAFCSINKQDNYNSLKDGKVIKIAIIDSGIDEKKARVQVEKRFSDDNKTKDILGHGTAIASIIASKRSFQDDFEGVYPRGSIYDANVLDENGNATIEEIVSAVEWSISQEVDIINMSFGVENDDDRLHRAIKKATDNNIIIVAAAGNTLGMYTEYPAKYEEVLSISAVDEKMNLFKYSAKGKINFVAPGVDIEAIKIGNLSNQETLSGTSFATAYAAAIIAILLDENKIDNENYQKTLLEYAHPVKGKENDPSYGNGLLKIK
ncbi:S8 family serine peptidase [Oceanobacillus sojae]|uniref:S8 family serine peptidase n=1 Tax=Oceanobacillus sojae TaxID=582851 RepID=UPI0011BF6ED1|nr:S8 family serine peptidase [Oceanobacillus sojae]